MKLHALLLPALWLVLAPAMAQDAPVEDELMDLEFRTSKYVSGKTNMITGFAKLSENVRQIACKSYPTDSDVKAITLFKAKIASLESEQAASKLDQAQVARLQVQKELVSRLSPGIDCSKLQ